MRAKEVVALLLPLSALIGGCEPWDGVSWTPAEAPAPRLLQEPQTAPRYLEVGSSLTMALKDLAPHQLYELRLYPEQERPPAREAALSFARVSADGSGAVAPFVLWYQTGIVGCAVADDAAAGAAPSTFRTFEDAERALVGRAFQVSVHPVGAGAAAAPPLTLPVGAAQRVERVIIAPRRSPLLLPSDEVGCPRAGQPVGAGPVYVTGRGFAPGERVELAVVPGQRDWLTGDPAEDITGALGAPASSLVRADERGRFTALAWRPESQRRGAFDLIARRGPVVTGCRAQRCLGPADVVSFGLEPGLVLYDPLGAADAVLSLTARPVTRPPYLEPTRAFNDREEEIHANLDDAGLPLPAGARYAAYHTVPHRGVREWTEAPGGVALADVSGGAKILPMKPGVVAGAAANLWGIALTPGQYDVVVELGGAGGAGIDGVYRPEVDLLDGGDQHAFTIAAGPYLRGAYAIGRASYSFDDYFASIGLATEVDLRAVVRYPAVAEGDDAAVAPGAFPLFVFQHGNHCFCDTDNPACLPQAVNKYTHASCPDRTQNHMGHIELLELLASHGFIAVSIDAYDLSGLVPPWITERGQLMLRHLELWSHLNDAATYGSYPDPFSGRFAGHVDMARISLSGHSRGGEGAISAFEQNTAFSIKAVSAIAPTDFLGSAVRNAPLLVIVPAADFDVSDLAGVRIYDRSSGSSKSGVYIYGANHNFFNSLWAEQGDESDPQRPEYLTPPEQRRIGEAYLSAFTRLHLQGRVEYLDMLRGTLRFRSIAGFKLYPMHQDQAHVSVELGDGDRALASGVSAGTLISPSVHMTRALRVDWAGEGTLSYPLPPELRDLRGYQTLALRVAQTNSPSNPVSVGQDFIVELVGGGRVQAHSVCRFGQVPVPYQLPLLLEPHNVMTTVRLPLASFVMTPSGPPLSSIDTIRLRFRQPLQGELYVDDIELAR